MLEKELYDMVCEFVTMFKQTTWQEFAMAAGIAMAGFCLYVGLWAIV